METVENSFTKNNRLIKEETGKTIFISLAMVASVIIYAAIAIFLSKSAGFKIVKVKPSTLQNIFNILNLLAILMVIVILAIRKTIYYSPKFIADDISLKSILMIWKKLDLILLAFGESISILGLIVTLLGVPFSRSFHFFATSVLVILIIMPVNWKVRDKLKILERQRDFYFDF